MASCTTQLPAEIRVVEVPVQPEYTHPVMPLPIALNDPAWFIIPLEDGTYAAVKIEDYQQVIENFTELGSYVQELRAIIKYYRNITNAGP